MNITSQEILKLLRNECSPEEAAAILAFLEQHPAVFEAFTEEEWRLCQEDVRLHPAISNRMLSLINRRRQTATEVPEPAPVWRFNRRWIAVAAVMLAATLVTVAVLVFSNQETEAPVAVRTPAATIVATAVPPVVIEINHSTASRTLHLPDGSLVELYPGSELRFSRGFDTARRDVHLKGRALFNVVQNRKQPFTVFAGPMATTALGTVFRISTEQAMKRTLIQLISGKVVVRATDGSARHRPVYLLPGETLDCNYARELVWEKQGPGRNAVSPAGIAPVATGPVLTFNLTPLPQVFELLQKRFHITIHYPGKALAHISFSGEFDTRKTSVQEMLAAIAALNDLRFDQRDQAYFINLP